MIPSTIHSVLPFFAALFFLTAQKNQNAFFTAGLRIDFVIFMKPSLEEILLLNRSVFRSSAKISPKDLFCKIISRSKIVNHRNIHFRFNLFSPTNALGLSCFLRKHRFVCSLYPSTSFLTCTPLHVSQL